MTSYETITYKGKEILYLDFRKAKTEQEMIDMLVAGEKYLLNRNIPMLLLENITGKFALPDFTKKAQEVSKNTKHLTLKEAIVGINGAKKLLLTFYSKFTGINIRAFNDEDEAKEYLVKN